MEKNKKIMIYQKERVLLSTGWVSEETDDALEAIELTLTPQEINGIS